ncbi:uncharacterized protein LOC124274881 [Haliotis rubra]|uniref:uncharacterized protein LOC124274881 n=1 Tax=Haliotis rubra TaxID=36100 RepID=UPI001EE52FA9|nr:uncharacterized protein LOC124274881 [Haliotis rubra]
MPGVEGTGYVPYVPDKVPISGEYSSIVGGAEMVTSPKRKGGVAKTSDIKISLGGAQSSSMSMLDIERRHAASAMRVDRSELAHQQSVWDIVGNTLVRCYRAVVGEDNDSYRAQHDDRE